MRRRPVPLATAPQQGFVLGSTQGGEDKMELPSSQSIYRKILVPYDGSDGAEQALRRALYLVSALGGAYHGLQRR